MREVVIIGGGLSGLAAAWKLEQHHIPYTIIEVKPRLGGSIRTVSENCFTMDAGAMCHTIADRAGFMAYLEMFDLSDAVFPVSDNEIIFKQGTGVLIDALAKHITAPIMHRMAVSTLGRMEDYKRFSICMENGMLLDAGALIVAAPAVHAERMFHTLTPEISFRLLDYRYDTITRVSAAYLPTEAPPHSYKPGFEVIPPANYPVVSIHGTSHADRVPTGGVLFQAALRMSIHDVPDDPIGELAALMGWSLNTAADLIATWTESDPIMWRDPQHPSTMQWVQNRLPQGVALIGSDYIPYNTPPCLDERIDQGIEAAQKIINWLKHS